MAHLGKRNQDDLVYQLNDRDLKIGDPPNPTFGNVTATGTVTAPNGEFENLVVSSGATLPAFNQLYVRDSGNSRLGTVISGVWNGSGIEEQYGGTGQSSYAPGDILVATGVDELGTLPSGEEGTALRIQGGAIGWSFPTVVSPVGATYTAAKADRFIMASGALVVTLPATASLGQQHTVKDRDGLASTTGISVSSAATIDGSGSYTLLNNYEAANFVWNGSSWSVF